MAAKAAVQNSEAVILKTARNYTRYIEQMTSLYEKFKGVLKTIRNERKEYDEARNSVLDGKESDPALFEGSFDKPSPKCLKMFSDVAAQLPDPPAKTEPAEDEAD
jgi:hypothetical protein